jgi:predicted amidohydrolase
MNNNQFNSNHEQLDNKQNKLTIAAVQMNSQQDITANLATIKAAISDACVKGAHLVVLPENCCSMGQQFATAERFDSLSATLADYAREHKVYVLAGSLPCAYRPDGIIVPAGRLRQVSQLFAPDGRQVARYDKIHLFMATVADKQGSYNEAATFEPGTQTVVTAIEAHEAVYQLGMMVCFDLRFPALAQRLRQAGAEMLSAPSAFTYLTGQAHWSLLLQARALDSQCMVIGAAQGGDHAYKDGHIRQTWGHAAITAFDGKLMASYDNSQLNNKAVKQNYALVLATLDRPAQQQGRQKMPIFDCHRLA